MGDKRPAAFLTGIADQKTPKAEAESLLDELAALARTLDIEVAGRELVTARERHPKFGMGTGKAAELAEKALAIGADCLIFDWDPSPSQQRNWEELAGIPVVDRQELIIRIFAERALTREAELQVRLAELSYRLPRLAHKYIDLSRQRGGRYGTRGTGETRLETDRRFLEQRIHSLEKEIEAVRKQRQVQRRQRERQGIPVCAVVGYTNAGKSTLFNALTGSSVAAEDKLFVTLDAASRRFEPARGRPVLMVDTVGLIRRLPHALVNAFRATLEEASLADLLIHVIDASDPEAGNFCRTTLRVLDEQGAGGIPVITVLNKTDRAGTAEDLAALLKQFPGSIAVSALKKTGLDELAARIDQAFLGTVLRFRFPPGRTDLVSLLYRSGSVISEKYGEEYIEIEARAGGRTAGMLKEYEVPAPPG
ncbi:MAG: GTPase HflX [Treponema sp.]|jgi:GTP-binding protein HflX|nr:GTPase HflX [Treponema sp.]